MFRSPAHRPVRRAVGLVAVALVIAACGNDDDGPSRGQVLSEAPVATLTTAQIDAATASPQLPIQALTGPARCDVTITKLVHATPGARGEPNATASAALLTPVASATCPGPFPLVAYDRGTDVVKARTLASATDGETLQLVGFLASQGYAVVATDYLGFADSNYAFHPYLHAASQASTTIDAIRAARTALAQRNVPLSGRLFLTGYSQGGHASMAAQRAIEADPSLGLTVTAGGHMSGPYDLAGSFAGGVQFLPTGTAGSSVFTAYVATAYQKIYGNLYGSAAEFFRAPYAAGIDDLLPGTLTFGQLVAQNRLPANLGDLLTPTAVASVTDTASGFRRALDANTLLGWRPAAPVLLCGGSRDPVVLFAANTPVAAQSLTAAGGNVTVVDVEQVPQFAAALPPPGATPQQLATYHGVVVPPLCLSVVRDRLFAPLR